MFFTVITGMVVVLLSMAMVVLSMVVVLFSMAVVLISRVVRTVARLSVGCVRRSMDNVDVETFSSPTVLGVPAVVATVVVDGLVHSHRGPQVAGGQWQATPTNNPPFRHEPGGSACWQTSPQYPGGHTHTVPKAVAPFWQALAEWRCWQRRP